MTETHKKKLSYLKQRRAEKTTVNENSGCEKEQKKSKETVSTKNFSSDLPSGADKNKPKNAQKKRRRKNKTKANKQTGNTPGSPKIGMTTDDVIFVGESSGESEHKSPKEREPKHSTCSESKQAKNAPAPGTKKSYAEAMKNGAKSTTPRMNKESVQKTLQSVLTTVQQLMRCIQQNGEHGVSSGVRTETHGKGPRRGQSKSQGAKRRF